MNLNQIIPGMDYVLLPYRGRGEEFRWDDRLDQDRWVTHLEWQAKYHTYRVKAMRVYSEREEGAKRDTGYVDVFWLTRDGEFKLGEDNKYIIKKVRVRDIATLWEDYEDELDFRKAKRSREEAERRERAAKQEQEYQERREREQREYEERLERQRIEREEAAAREREKIRAIEQHYGLPEGSVRIDAYGIQLNKEMIEVDMLKETPIHEWFTR